MKKLMNVEEALASGRYVQTVAISTPFSLAALLGIKREAKIS